MRKKKQMSEYRKIGGNKARKDVKRKRVQGENVTKINRYDKHRERKIQKKKN
jgi:hypothetical protein